MSTIGLIAADLTLALLCAAAWLGAAISAAAGRGRAVWLITAAAVAVTLARAGIVAVLAGRGWWFVSEKVVFALPLLGLTAAVAGWVLVRCGVPAARVPCGRPDSVPPPGCFCHFSSGTR
ncbi:MAG TPA: hypothetical protein VFC19_54970 [Candidatus Limnocylindrales bacterium]|nr:hypothetical protein [Candidatus Limnocylindrales bacterium]